MAFAFEGVVIVLIITMIGFGGHLLSGKMGLIKIIMRYGGTVLLSLCIIGLPSLW